jgi:hypothetical protein
MSEEPKGKRGRGRPPLEQPSVQVALRLEPDLVEALKDEAAGVPLATWIARILRQHVDAQRSESQGAARVLRNRQTLLDEDEFKGILRGLFDKERDEEVLSRLAGGTNPKDHEREIALLARRLGRTFSAREVEIIEAEAKGALDGRHFPGEGFMR